MERVGNFFSALVRGVGQVMFQHRTRAGLVMLLGVIVAPVWSETRVALIPAVTASLVIATVVAYLCKIKGRENGLWGFNGVLVGCAVATFFNVGTWAWILMTAGVLLTVALKVSLDRFLRGASFTLPFVLATWIIILFGFKTGLCTPFITEGPLESMEITPMDYGRGLLKGVSQVFLIDSYDTGLVILVALYCASYRVALLALAGSASGMALAWLTGCAETEIVSGIWGFSPVLTAIAIGSVMHGITRRWAWTAGAIALTFLIQYITTPLLQQAGMPVLTMPFCAATIIVEKLADGFNKRKKATAC